MNTQTDAAHGNDAAAKPEKEVKLTISTLNGDYRHEWPEDQTLRIVVDDTVEKLKLVANGPWVLERNGVELPLGETIKAAGLKDDDVLTLSSQEGGGGSGRL